MSMNVKAIREKMGITQAELARRMGVAYQTVNRWEKNRTQPSRMAQRLLKEINKEGVK